MLSLRTPGMVRGRKDNNKNKQCHKPHDWLKYKDGSFLGRNVLMPHALFIGWLIRVFVRLKLLAIPAFVSSGGLGHHVMRPISLITHKVPVWQMDCQTEHCQNTICKAIHTSPFDHTCWSPFLTCPHRSRTFSPNKKSSHEMSWPKGIHLPCNPTTRRL